MNETPQTDELAERLARVQSSGPKARRTGLNPYALSAVAALAGTGLGAWLVLASPEPATPVPAIATASVSDFQDGAGGTEGFSITRTKPSPAPDPRETQRLNDEIGALRAEIAALKANPLTVTDDAALNALKTQIATLDDEARQREGALSELERENIRLQTALDTKALIASDQNDEAARAREDDLARRRAEAKALIEAQINSDMVALRNSSAVGGGGNPMPDFPQATGTGDEAFRRAGAPSAPVQQAQVIANPAHTVMQGTLIEAALETAISTDLEGNVSALVSHDVWSFDMSRVLIARGSRLFGRYDSDIDAGQKRVLIAWDRLVTTDGQTVNLAAYGTDRIGRSGLPGRVHAHFLQRFGSAALVSVIGAFPAIAAAKYAANDVTSDTAKNVGTDLGTAVGNVMAGYLAIPPTISVDQGAVVMVRVDADIEFF